MGASHRTSLSLLIGLGAAGCMPHGSGAPSAEVGKPAVTRPEASQASGLPLMDEGDPSQQAVLEAVNKQDDRISRIIRERDQAKQLAADAREQREARALARAQRENEAAGGGDTPEQIEQLAATLRDAVKKSATDTEAAKPEKEEDAWANTGLSAAEPVEDGDFGDRDAIQARRIQGAQGSVSAPVDVQRVTPAPGPAGVSRQPAPATISGIDPLLAIQEQYQNRVNDRPRDLAAHLELQLARLLRNEPVPAMADLSTLSGEDRELLAAVSDALSNFRNLVRNDANPLGAEKARPFIEMADRIRARSDLSVQSVNLCTSVKAFGNYDPIEPLQFVAGNPSWSVFYCEVDGFLSQLNDRQLWESKLSLELRLYNMSGMQFWRAAPETVSDTSRKRRRDFFIAKRIQLPSTLAPGPYMLKATIRDLQANRVAESTLQVSIIGK